MVRVTLFPERNGCPIIARILTWTWKTDDLKTFPLHNDTNVQDTAYVVVLALYLSSTKVPLMTLHQ